MAEDEHEPQAPRPEDAAQAAALLFPDDPVVQAIMAQTGKRLEVRMREVEAWLDEKPSLGPGNGPGAA